MEYSYNIVRSARKTICLTVSFDNKITVRCPYRTSEAAITRFVQSKSGWLDRILSRNSAKLSENTDITDFKKIYVGGQAVPLVISDKNKITDGAVYVKDIRHIKSTFVSHFADSFTGNVKDVAKERFDIADVNIKDYKSRWGCCDNRRRLSFNYKIFMLPFELQRYIIIHELCHTVYFNHSQSFWRLVEKFEPNYKTLRKRLKSFDFITKLY